MPPSRGPLPTLLPKPTQAGSNDQEPTVAHRDSVELPPKRRQVNQACEGCRKRKTKCDGTRPRCGSCVRAGLNCHFGPAKADPRYESYRSVVELLRERSQAESAQVLKELREADNLDGTVNTIADARLLLQAAPTSGPVSTVRDGAEPRPPVPQLSRPGKRRLGSPHEDPEFMFEKQFMVDPRDQYVDKDIFVDVPSQNLPLSRWTQVSNDDRLMNHLLRMFWTWDNTVEKCFYRPIFEEDVTTLDPSLGEDRGRFCSRFLVNALLAAGSLFTMDSTTFKEPGDPSSRGRSWADEAHRLLDKIEPSEASFPLLQGLMCLFIYDGNLALGSTAMRCYFRAMAVYKVLNEQQVSQPHARAGVDEARALRERQATSWCIWGHYCCEWRATQALGLRKQTRKPRFPKLWREADFPLSLPDSSGYWWFPYPMSLKIQRSMKVEIREADATLSEIVEEVLDFIYPEDGKLSQSLKPQRALELYRKINDWKACCPDRLRLEDAVLPPAILLHISAEIMFTTVLRPFSHMSKERFGKFDPRDRCYAHASSLMSAIWTFRAFACLRFEYWLCHALGTAAYIVVGGTDDAPIQVETLMRACQCLQEMRAFLPLATDILCGIHAALKSSRLPVPALVERYFARLQPRKDGLMHHAVAALLPTSTMFDRVDKREVQLQELLVALEDMGVD